jgi:phosphatidylinositol alpha-mannosyltransferase
MIRLSMRIAIVSDYYYPQLGGITEQVHGQATELTRRGHEVLVITPKLALAPRTVDGDDLPERTFELLHVGRAWPFYMNGAETLVSLGARIPRRLDRIFSERRFDVVHVHNPFGLALPMAGVLRSTGSATVGTLHSVVPEGHRLLGAARRPLRHLLGRLEARVAVSEAVVESIGAYFPDLDFRTIPNGIDTEFFSPAATPIDRLDGRRNIVFVGRFDPRNSVRTMIGAFTRLRRSRDDIRLVIVGDGPLRPLVERIVPSEVRADVIFAGRVNRLRPRYLASAEILCTPCSLASFGMVLLEGMSASLPVVASRLPGFELVMRNGVDGVLVDRHDDEAGFANALDRLLDDPALSRRMGAAGRQRALYSFSWPIVGDKLEALYEELLGGDRAPLQLRRAA